MNTFIKKTILATLTGIVFLLGGVSTVQALTQAEIDQLQKLDQLQKSIGSPTAADANATDQQMEAFGAEIDSRLQRGLTPVAGTSNTSGAASGAQGVSGGWSYSIVSGNSDFTLSPPYATEALCETARPTNKEGACKYYSLSDREVATGNISANDDPLIAGLKCDFSWKTGFELGGCLPLIIYSTVYKLASLFLLVGAEVFDFSLKLSINQEFVNQPFVTSAWEIVRDFSNMVFIFILLYTGILTMLGTSGARKTIVNVIIVALLINFSLFFTKIVIDAGNVLAVGVYESMGPPPPDGQPREISAAIVASFAPQQFAFIGAERSLTPTDRTIIFTVATVVCAVAGWIFLTIALVFIGRLLAFWFLMIVSPFAFISIILPKGQQFGAWFSELLKQSMVAPMFLFMLYLIMQFVNAGGGIFTSSGSPSMLSSEYIYQVLLIPVLKATLIIYALFKARDYAKDFSGGFGKVGSEIIGKGLGFAAGGVAGVGGFAGRTVVGGLAAAALKKGWISPTGKTADVARYMKKASFDARNIGGKDSIFGATIGGKITQGIGSLGVGTGAGVGGVAAATATKNTERRKKDKEIKNVAEIPMLKAKLATMIADHKILQTANGDTLDSRTGATITQGAGLKTDLSTKEATFLAAELAVKANPSDAILQATFIRELAAKKAAEKTLKKYEDGEDNIEKLEAKIETYENL